MSRFWSVILTTFVIFQLYIIAVEQKQVSRRFLWDMMTVFVDPQHRCLECYNCNCHWKKHPTECSGWSADCLFIVDHQNCSVPYHYNGGWSQWEGWGNCSGTCGSGSHGTQIRLRLCNNPEPHNCGKSCEGPPIQTQHCDPCNPTASSQTFTLVPPSATPLTSSHPTTTAVMMPTICNRFCAIGKVASSNPYNHPDASTCPDGSQTGPEVMPLVCCIVPPVSTWKEGINVMSNCGSIPLYTPVAIFTFGHYVTATAGIFTGCLQNSDHGFTMALQKCGETPTIVNVVKNSTVDDHPDAYFTIH